MRRGTRWLLASLALLMIVALVGYSLSLWLAAPDGGLRRAAGRLRAGMTQPEVGAVMAPHGVADEDGNFLGPVQSWSGERLTVRVQYDGGGRVLIVQTDPPPEPSLMGGLLRWLGF